MGWHEHAIRLLILYQCCRCINGFRVYWWVFFWHLSREKFDFSRNRSRAFLAFLRYVGLFNLVVWVVWVSDVDRFVSALVMLRVHSIVVRRRCDCQVLRSTGCWLCRTPSIQGKEDAVCIRVIRIFSLGDFSCLMVHEFSYCSGLMHRIEPKQFFISFGFR